MQVSISGHHLEITQAIEQYTRTKLAKLEHHNHYITKIHVCLVSDSKQKKAEAQVSVPHHTIVAEAYNDDLYVAIDALISKLDRQLIKQKEKLASNRHK